MRKGPSKDGRAMSSNAAAALLSIAVLLIYLRAVRSPNGSEEVFFAVFVFVKWIARIIGVPDLFKEFEEFIKYLQGTPMWPLAATILAYSLMAFSIWVTFYGSKVAFVATTRIFAWFGGVRARRHERKVGNKWNSALFISKAKAAGGKRGLELPKRLHKGSISCPKKEAGAAEKEARNITSWFKKEWWQIRETSTITPEKGKLGEIILGSKKLFPTNRSPEGSFIELARALNMDSQSLRRAVEEGRDAMTVGNLMKLLKVAEVPYDTVTPYIRAVGARGDKEAIRNPKFPIDLSKPEAGVIFAAALKDGDINVAHHHFEYVNFDEGKRRAVAEAVDRDGRVKGIHYQTSLIGDTLLDFGAVAGRKADQDYHVPPPVRFGSREIKNAYFNQVIKDEGSIDRGDYRLTISGAGEIASKMTQEHRRMLDHLPFEDGHWPSGAPKKYITLKQGLEDDLPDDLKPIYKDFIQKMKDEWAPTILLEEKKLLEEMYNIKVEIQPRQIYVGKKVGIRGSWALIIGGKYEVIMLKSELNHSAKNGGDEN
ncbi:MAG: hypothetical protein JTT11_09870 [Candidatus Brockarchaeota archaeon]|nr:hypothetical protein [Candidatus Brockarchaeota archaeon]